MKSRSVSCDNIMQLDLFTYASSALAELATTPATKRRGKIVSSPPLHKTPTAYTAPTVYNLPQFKSSKAEREGANRRALTSDDPACIYQNFTGKGGLHEVKFADHGNFHDFIRAKQEFEAGQFFTPAPIATTGVLKVGVNIPEAEIVITDSYPWNFV